MGTPNLLIAIGAILIAAGGYLATYGWNTRSQEAQKSGMVRSVAAEWLINMSVINDPKFAETDERELSQFVIFPRMQLTALEGTISSGLFLNEKDRLYLTRAVDLNEFLTTFNLRLSFTESQMGNNRGDIRSFRTTLRDGATRTQLMIKLKKFGELLMSEYGVKESDRFFVPLEEDANLPRNPN